MSIRTKQRFVGDHQVHIEWRTPEVVKGKGQNRGNSGVFLGGFGELQVLDSINNDTYPDGPSRRALWQVPAAGERLAPAGPMAGVRYNSANDARERTQGSRSPRHDHCLA